MELCSLAISSFGEKNKLKTSAIFIKDDVLVSISSDKWICHVSHLNELIYNVIFSASGIT